MKAVKTVLGLLFDDKFLVSGIILSIILLFLLSKLIHGSAMGWLFLLFIISSLLISIVVERKRIKT